MIVRQVEPNSAYTLPPGAIPASVTLRTRRSTPSPSGEYGPSGQSVSKPEW